MAPPGPSATEYLSPVSRGPHLYDQVTAKAVGCQNDFAYSLTLKTCADNIQNSVCTAKLYCKLQFQILSINNYRNQPHGNIRFILLGSLSVEENGHHVVIRR